MSRSTPRRRMFPSAPSTRSRARSRAFRPCSPLSSRLENRVWWPTRAASRGEGDAKRGHVPQNLPESTVLNGARIAGTRLELEPHDQRVVGDIGDAVDLERLDDVGFEVRHQLVADLLGCLAQLLEVGVAGKPQIELNGRPVTAVVGYLAQFTEGNDLDLAVGVPQPDRAQGKALDRSLGLAATDV